MKALARLAVLILMTPALLLAQTPTAPSAAPQASDKKAAAAPSASSAAQTPAAPAGQAADQNTEAPKAEAPKPRVPGPYPVMSDRAKQRARELYGYFARGQSVQLYAAFATEMKKQSSEAKLANISKQVTTNLGNQTNVLSETFLPGMGGQPMTLYGHTAMYSKSKVAVMVLLGVSEEGQLLDLQVLPMQPLPRDEYSDYQDVAKLHLPFNGEWMVLQGGRNTFDNANALSDENRYATSFIFLKDGMPFEGSGRKNTDYYCFGQPVLAPAAGTVVQSSNSYQDHAPGRPTDVQTRGNYIVIAHGNGEFSMFPYLKAGSVKARIGQRVKQGDVIAECGNSGSSPFPHLEYSLQNTKGFPMPKTMPAQFVDYVADGKPVPVGEPLRGQTVSNPKTDAVQTAGKP